MIVYVEGGIALAKRSYETTDINVVSSKQVKCDDWLSGSRHDIGFLR